MSRIEVESAYTGLRFGPVAVHSTAGSTLVPCSILLLMMFILYFS